MGGRGRGRGRGLLELTTLIDVGFVFSVMFDSKFLQSDQSILSIFLPLEKQN